MNSTTPDIGQLGDTRHTRRIRAAELRSVQFPRVPLVSWIFMVILLGVASLSQAADTSEPSATDQAAEATSTEEVAESVEAPESSAMHASDAFIMWKGIVAEQPVNVSVLFNAGLAAARAEKLGYARLYLERARVLAPFDREVRDTLALVKQAIGREQLEALGGDKYTEGSPAGVGSWRLTRLVPESISALCLVGFLWLFAFAFMADNRRRGTRRHVVAMTAMFAGLSLALIAAVFWGGARWTGTRITPAVVVAASPAYQSTPDELGTERTSAELYEGALVAIEAQADSWSRVRLADESTVWVKNRLISPLAPDGGN